MKQKRNESLHVLFPIENTFLQEMSVEFYSLPNPKDYMSLYRGTMLQRLGAAQRGKARSKTKIQIPLRSPQRTCKDGWKALATETQHTGHDQHFHIVPGSGGTRL